MAVQQQELEEFTGVIAGPRAVRFHKDNFIIVEVTSKDGDPITCKGTMTQPTFGAPITFKGRSGKNPRFPGVEFKFQEYTVAYPTDKEGIRVYLQTTAKWIGPVISRAIVERYGEQALEVLKTDPERVAAEITGVTIERAQQIATDLKANEEHEKVQVELRSLLGPAGVTQRQFKAIIDRYGKAAPEAVRANPYKLIEEISGIGWQTADKIGQTLGLASDSPDRIRAGLLHTINEAEDKEGHTCVPHPILERDAALILGVGTDAVRGVLNAMLQEGVVVAYGPNPDIYREFMYKAEFGLAQIVSAFLDDNEPERIAMAEIARRKTRSKLSAFGEALGESPFGAEHVPVPLDPRCPVCTKRIGMADSYCSEECEELDIPF